MQLLPVQYNPHTEIQIDSVVVLSSVRECVVVCVVSVCVGVVCEFVCVSVCVCVCVCMRPLLVLWSFLSPKLTPFPNSVNIFFFFF